MDYSITHNSEQKRFELTVDGTLASYSDYFDTDGARNFHHTVTVPQYRGHGLAAVLTEHALDDTREQGLRVQASCWFVREFIESNSAQYGDLIA